MEREHWDVLKTEPEIFRLKNAIFIGKDVTADIDKVASILDLSLDETNDLTVIETNRAYQFCEALASGGERLAEWLETGEGGMFDEVSLKDFCQFINDKAIIDT